MFVSHRALLLNSCFTSAGRWQRQMQNGFYCRYPLPSPLPRSGEDDVVMDALYYFLFCYHHFYYYSTMLCPPIAFLVSVPQYSVTPQVSVTTHIHYFSFPVYLVDDPCRLKRHACHVISFQISCRGEYFVCPQACFFLSIILNSAHSQIFFW